MLILKNTGEGLEDVDEEIRDIVQQRYEEYIKCIIDDTMFEYRDVYSLISLSLVVDIDPSKLGVSFLKNIHRDVDEEVANLIVKVPFTKGWKWSKVQQIVRNIPFNLLYNRWVVKHLNDYDLITETIEGLPGDERIYFITTILHTLWQLEYLEHHRKDGGTEPSINAVVLVDLINDQNLLDKQVRIVDGEQEDDNFYNIVETHQGYVYINDL